MGTPCALQAFQESTRTLRVPYCKYSKYFVRCYIYCEYYEYSQYGDTHNMPRILEYSEYEVYFDRLRTVSTLHDGLPENMHRCPHEWELGQVTFGGGGTGVSRVLGAVPKWSVDCEYSLYFRAQYVLQAFFGRIHNGCCLYAGLLCTGSIWAFSTLVIHAPGTRRVFAASAAILSILGVRNAIDTPTTTVYSESEVYVTVLDWCYVR